MDEIKNRGYLSCGVSENQIGFSTINDEGKWIGFDVDICRAVASAIFNDPEKVEFIVTTSSSRFPKLAGGEIDILSRTTTWTYSRDTNLGFDYSGISFFDGQTFMVRKSLDIKNINDLQDSTICLVSGSAKEFNTIEYFKKNNIRFNILNVEIDQDALENYLADRCDAYTNFYSELSILRVKIPNSSKHMILTDLISKEPLGPLVRHGDNEWNDIVRWTLNVLIIAEEYNIDSINIDTFLETDNAEIKRILGIIGNYGDMLELDNSWSYNIIKNVGNYKTIFDTNLGQNTALKMSRGLNDLWKEGGILYSPPFR